MVTDKTHTWKAKTMAAKRPAVAAVAELPDRIELDEKEQDAVNRLAARYGLKPDSVIQILAALAKDEAAKGER
jgi:hypothetical protein